MELNNCVFEKLVFLFPFLWLRIRWADCVLTASAGPQEDHPRRPREPDARASAPQADLCAVPGSSVVDAAVLGNGRALFVFVSLYVYIH